MTPHLHDRREFLAKTGAGVTSMALTSLFFRDGELAATEAHADVNGLHHAPRAKSVIWIFLIGGLSHLESFDPKPTLNKYANQSIDDTPFAEEVLNPDKINNILLDPAKQKREVYKKIMPLQTGYRAHGQSGLLFSDWFPRLGTCADDVTFARGMWTIDNNHGAQLTYHTGRKVTEGAFPTVGAWASYGLGSLNENFPEYVVLGTPSADCCGAAWTHGAAYLGPEHAGVRIKVDAKQPMAFVQPADPKLTPEEQRENFNLLGELNRLAGKRYPTDPRLRARIKSYELAFQMQTAVPEVMDLTREPKHVHTLYGADQNDTKAFGEKCLAVRRLVERGVRFVQLFHGYTGSAGAWDSHTNLKSNHTRLCKQVDRPIAGLIKDLKQRGLLDETLVVLGSEFGRTPGLESLNQKVGTGRDHHPHGFTVLMAGGGVRRGYAYGATDVLGFHAIEKRHYVTDLHATALHQLGLDAHKLNYPGRIRLDRDYGEVMHGILT